MYYSLKLNKIKNLKHCFFSRKNGFSSGLYESLNCGLGSNDKKINIIKNLEFVSNKIGCKQESLITLNQEHTNQVVLFKNKNDVKNKLTGDAMVTTVKNLGIGILTADCAPILFYDPNKKIIGCAHSGWKGALNGIIENTVKKFNELKSNAHDLVAVVGPCLSKDSYEVKNDFMNKFVSNDKKNLDFFKKKSSTHYNFDLRGFINNKLRNLGIKNIDNIEMDTFSEREFFYSYRRSCHNNENDYGRCISVILMT
jgi:polyphenol oxidase